MCGIIGYLSNTNESFDILWNGLFQLQNRGYDSVGITTVDCSHNFVTNKYVSEHLNNCLDLLQQNKINHKYNKSGIGHTRWATHGAPTINNSHPHTCLQNLFTIVHNGIIENYITLKKELTNNGFTNFKSETDSEIIVNLISMYYNIYKNTTKTIEEIIEITCSKLDGTYGIVILFKNKPGVLYCIRKGSPLLIGHNNYEAYIVSETSAFNNNIKQYYEITSQNVYTIYFNVHNILTIDNRLNIDNNITKTIVNNIIDISYKPYTCWMEKEILEQVESTNRALSFGGRILSNYMVKLGGLENYIDEIEKLNNLLIVGCGTSYYSSMVGVTYFKDLCNFENIEYVDGCEFNSDNIKKNKKTGIIFLSQSGETMDLIKCIEISKDKNCFLIGVVNVVDSQIARMVNCGVYLNAGREVSVASTKSFTSQCIVLSLISIWISQLQNINKLKRIEYIKSLRQLSNNIKYILTNKINILDNWVGSFINEPSCFVIGKEELLPIALEGSLKLKEVSYIHAEGISANSLKHGPLALIRDKFPVILLVKDDNNVIKLINCFEELKSRYATIFVITTSEKFNNYVNSNSNNKNCLYIEDNNSNFSNILINITLQCLSLKISKSKNISSDKPRNLAKVVTV
jgi:glucosamine--fructose-6-phosphate aminotransferase (isomerizing)